MEHTPVPFRSRRPQAGFTLVELIIVIVITGILAAVLAVFFKPAIDAYFGSKRRADMTDMADGALRRMARDIRFAVPNSIRTTSPLCFEVVPASAGGRYRLAPDVTWDAANPSKSAPIDGTTPVSAFDVLALSNAPASGPRAGDYVVIDNQNPDDVYQSNINRATISDPAAAVPAASVALRRITLTAPYSFPAGYFEGRFMVVPSDQYAVFYYCKFPAGGNVDAQGNGTGTVYRASGYAPTATAAACPAATTAPVVATNVSNCTFNYSPSDGATQNGFMWMQIQLQQSGESVTLSYGTHVDNIP